jgi:peptidoglycan hydrolase CwlO-like protein
LNLKTEDIFFAMVNAIKELDKKINDAVAAMKEQGKILKQVQNDMAALKKENEELKARLAKLEARL